MAYNARVFRIFIASPSDVEEEREVISRIIREWNDLHSFERKIVLLPLRWETHSAPELGKRPQEIINTEIVDHADMAVGVFWTRIGTPTGEYASGTIEEIERLGMANKIVMCYFSKAKVELDAIDLDQYKQLKEFKKKTYPNGLVESYSNIVKFRDKFAKQLEIKVRGLISKDNSSGEQSIETKPNIEFEFINPHNKEIIGNQYNVRPQILKVSKADLNLIPDFSTKKGKDDLFSLNKNYYREYFDYIKKTSEFIPIQFSLKNTSSIAIRDIFIEMLCEKKHEFKLTKETIDKPEKSRGVSFSFLTESIVGAMGSSNLGLAEMENSYKVQISYPALQPQRNVKIEFPFFISSSKKGMIDFNVNIYADCFATPLTKKLTISLDPKIINKSALEVLEEFQIIEK